MPNRIVFCMIRWIIYVICRILWQLPFTWQNQSHSRKEVPVHHTWGRSHRHSFHGDTHQAGHHSRNTFWCPNRIPHPRNGCGILFQCHIELLCKYSFQGSEAFRGSRNRFFALRFPPVSGYEWNGEQDFVSPALHTRFWLFTNRLQTAYQYTRSTSGIP